MTPQPDADSTRNITGIEQQQNALNPMKAAAVKDTAAKLLKKYPGRIPVICEPDVANSNGKASGQLSALPALDKKKFLVPGDLTVGQFIYVIRQRIKLAPEAALVVFVNDTPRPSSTADGEEADAKEKADKQKNKKTSMKMPATSENMSVVYDKHKAADGFLYITYTSENVFG